MVFPRKREINSLLTAFERVSGQGQDATAKSSMMLISGYSGIGKSALVQELYKPITQQRGYFISGKFDQYQRNIPYSAIVNAFQDLAKQLLAESEANLKEWREKLLDVLGINGQVLIDVIPEVELIIGKQSAPPELGATEAENRFNFVFQNFIKVFTKPEHPLTIFIDDLQWADRASLKLMQLLMSASSTGLFLIGAYRDNEVSGAHPLMLTIEEIVKTGAKVDRIFLSPLDLSSVTQLIADALVFQDFEAAYEFGALALKLVKQLKIQELKSNILLGVAINLIHVKSHLRESLPLLEESYLSGIQNGQILPIPRERVNC